MASEIRVNQIQNRSGLSTVTFSESGVVLSGVTTVSGSLNVSGNITGNLTGSVNLTSGITTVAAGSTSAPSITPTGDSDTGIFFPSADTIAVATGGSQRLRVTSTGRVVVKGPSNPSDYTLSDGIFVQPDNGLSGLTIATGSATNNSYLNFSKGTASNAEQFDFALGRDGTNNRGMVKIADNDVAFFTSNGIAFPNGKGIDFSAASNAGGMTSELFDDYEEGTFTATFAGSSYTTTGYYTKIGRLVHIHLYASGMNVTSSVGAVVDGLPFTVRNQYSTGAANHNTYTTNGDNFYFTTNGTGMYFYQQNTISQSSTNIGAARYVMMSGSYTTDT